MSREGKPIKKRWWLVSIGLVAVLWAGLAIVFDFFPEKEKELRRSLRNTVEETFPQQAAEVAKSFGLTYYGEDSTASLQIKPPVFSVVLIHGLDDPGKVWMNLAPALIRQNMRVWQMRYPNDQPIVDSAQFFYDVLRSLKQRGTRQIIIVAHSMGGLVSRQMLTSPQIGYIAKARTGDVPQVNALIMVGTPNHGSELARFRIMGEIREQFVNLLEGRGHILNGILDGAGEAKIDLLPESQFLQTLNRRPHPKGVKMLSIAGELSPWNERDIQRFVDSAWDTVPVAAQNMQPDLEAFLKSMSDGLGDGLVTVESTRLKGVEHRTVRGTHLSMIRNISVESSRMPPAVPLIIEYLEQM